MEINIAATLSHLTAKDTTAAYAALQELEQISEQSDILYPYTEQFIEMIKNKQYIMRVRGIRLVCKQAKWDSEHLIDQNLDAVLSILKDEKPTAVRQALSALTELWHYKKELRPDIKKRVTEMDYQKRYKETMHGLIAKDIKALLETE